MSHQRLYNKNHDIFLGYLKNTTQKEVLINKVRNRFENIKRKDFIFTDIGAGDGMVTLEIINFLKKFTKLKVNFIEPSRELMNIFKENNKYRFVKFLNKKAEEIKLPKSDFILSSHSIYYTDNFKSFVDSVLDSLKKDGIALIVKNNQKSGDIELKKYLAKKTKRQRKKSKVYFDIVEYLKKKRINYKVEQVKSRIDVSNCNKLNKRGESIMSFFYKKPFNQISKQEVEIFQKYIKKCKRGFIKKIEDYIWISND